jgi:hypothetical protein
MFICKDTHEKVNIELETYQVNIEHGLAQGSRSKVGGLVVGCLDLVVVGHDLML